MKTVIAALQSLYRSSQDESIFIWYNRLTDFVRNELPTIITILTESEQERERMKDRIAELENLLKEEQT